jgi:hypothetical protein
MIRKAGWDGGESKRREQIRNSLDWNLEIIVISWDILGERFIRQFVICA